MEVPELNVYFSAEHTNISGFNLNLTPILARGILLSLTFLLISLATTQLSLLLEEG